MSSSKLIIFLAFVLACVDALRINQAEKQAPTPASSTDLGRMQLNSYKSTKFQTWHEQMVAAVLGDQPDGNHNDATPRVKTLMEMGLTEGNFACGCPVGYSYFYAEQGEKASAYCSAWRQPAEPWKETAEKMVTAECPDPKANPMSPMSRAYATCSADSPPKLLCNVADEIVMDVRQNHKSKDDKGYYLTAVLADTKQACYWSVVPPAPKV